MKLRRAQALAALFLLFPGKYAASASRKSGGARSRSDDVIVGILVGTLLLLLLLLFLAWRHLSRTSGGKYHPRRLIRVLIFRLQELWEQARSEELSQGYPDEKQSDEELGEQREDDDDTEDEDDGEQQREEQREEQLPQRSGHEPEEEERQERLAMRAELEATEKEAAQGPTKEDKPPSSGAVEGNAGVLLCDLPSFSGTAAWEDSSKQAQATAL
ncbi:hypothetical protein JRQ81_000085 [Phrynocephalus forsythii]|uniref:Protein tyrosine phosphatase receptor type C-associated protein n=1 Tax=Phrynocephalus forsythii TaxID=171643 RepID=A0A9Q0Y4L8_9SAUR|nr:hypothetical protein JRQ81_000085 [Phrynocephalus forsythii]